MELEGKLNGRSKRVAVIVAKFNEFITENLLKGCLDELAVLGVAKKNIVVSRVPGAFEIPALALKFAKRKDVDAVICLGCVIRGETYHFEIVADNAAQGIMQASLISGKPVVLGVLSTNTVQEAESRSKLNGDNKGKDAAQTAVEMIDLYKQVSRKK